jgi:hypothetical protein
VRSAAITAVPLPWGAVSLSLHLISSPPRLTPYLLQRISPDYTRTEWRRMQSSANRSPG